MFDLGALPLVQSFSHSDRASERALFVRVYQSLIGECRRAGRTPPAEWVAALQACLARARPAEREHYLGQLDAALTFDAAAARSAARRVGRGDDVAGGGTLEERIALALDARTPLDSEHMRSLVAEARDLVELSGDRRLAEALLAREPLRLEAAPLFLEASPEQRWAILLEAQRAELGRRFAPAAPLLDADGAQRLEYAAIAGRKPEFAAALAEALGAAPDIAARIAADTGGEAMVAALIALGAARDVCVRVLTARDMQDGAGFPRIHALARLSQQLSAGAARRIVTALVGAAPAGATARAPKAAPRNAPAPSPFLRREASPRPAASRETRESSAPRSRTP